MRSLFLTRLTFLLFAAFTVALPTIPAAAQSYEAGLAAAKRGDYAAALNDWRPLAENGDAKAQFSLGFMYSHGDGVKQDYRKAAQWYRRAADQGDTKAQNNLGMMYGLGQGVPQDYRLSWMWFSLAADKGYAAAVHGRDLATQEMTSDELADARRMVRDWRERHPQ